MWSVGGVGLGVGVGFLWSEVRDVAGKGVKGRSVRRVKGPPFGRIKKGML